LGTDLGSYFDMHIHYVGDSDIYRWPKYLLPNPNVAAASLSDRIFSLEKFKVHGRDGALLSDATSQLRNILIPKSPSSHSNSSKVFIAYAGENDIGKGSSVDATVSEFRKFLVLVTHSENSFLLFIGPKIEPWLYLDEPSFRNYAQLSESMKRACAGKERVLFLDVLTLFCAGETPPGSVLDSRTNRADRTYFARDMLHLNDSGYRLLKAAVEEKLECLMTTGSWKIEG